MLHPLIFPIPLGAVGLSDCRPRERDVRLLLANENGSPPFLLESCHIDSTRTQTDRQNSQTGRCIASMTFHFDCYKRQTGLFAATRVHCIFFKFVLFLKKAEVDIWMSGSPFIFVKISDFFNFSLDIISI